MSAQPKLVPGFDLGRAYQALAAADPTLGQVISEVGPLARFAQTRGTPFDALLKSIVYQQLSGKAAATIYGRLRTKFPRNRPTPELMATVPESELRSAGLSRSKVLAARDLAAKTVEGTIPRSTAGLHRLDNEAIVERLIQVRGIGRWTVEMFLMFRLGRPDVLPTSDLGIQKGFTRMMGRKKLPQPEYLARHGNRWRPWRTVASWYLWELASR